MIGSIVGSYRIVSAISVGGMGTVYKAEHTLIGRLAAVKVLHPELSTSRDIVGRFFNEAKATTTIKHPGIVEVFDFGYMPSGHAFLVMEFLEGMPLTARAKARGAMPEGEAAMLLRGVCSALAAAHAKGIVHRDLKPDNIFVVPDAELGERTKILDFGIAKLTDIGLASSATKTGAVMGTPTYMSPEQCKGTGQVDHRADLYSLGCILFELVTGRPPFNALGAGELIGQHLFVQPESPSRFVQGLSPEVEALIMALLSKQPEHRPQTALELYQRLGQIAQAQGWLAPGTDVALRLSQVNIAAGPDGVRAAINTPHAPFPRGATPAHFTPAQLTPSHVTMPLPGASSPGHFTPGAPAHFTPAHVSIPEKPTTLSGAASEQRDAVAPKRKGRIIAIASGVVVAVGIGVGISVMKRGASDATPAAQPNAAPPSAAQPSAAQPSAAPPSTDQPTAAQPAPLAPPSTPQPPVTEPPAQPTAVADPPPAVPAPPVDVKPPAPPAKPPAPPKPDQPVAGIAKPPAPPKKPARPTAAHPTDHADKPAKPAKPDATQGPMETDL